jgi:putative methyltransferase (TIGR04325 family)
MKPRWKRWIADWIPPHVKRLLRGSRQGGAVRYSGNFSTWEQARRQSVGYDAPAIVEKVKQALLKVQRGEAACERDSVTFDEPQHSFPLLAGLLRAALRNGGRLNLLDIGGSLGSSYFQCRSLLGDVAELRWTIVEQPLFVACGREHFQTDELLFSSDLEACLSAERRDVALLSSVLPYVESPHDLLDRLAREGIAQVIIDRTPIWSPFPDRLTVQSVPSSIYGFPASYPAWILNRERLLAHFLPRFRLVAEFDALSGTIDVDGTCAKDTGFVFERNPDAR